MNGCWGSGEVPGTVIFPVDAVYEEIADDAELGQGGPIQRVLVAKTKEGFHQTE